MFGSAKVTWFMQNASKAIECLRKHSIAFEAFCMNQVTFALPNIKIRLRYFTYVFSRLIEGEKDYEKLLPSAVAR